MRSGGRKLCADSFTIALRAVGRSPDRRYAPGDFTQDERMRMVRAVLRENAFPMAEWTMGRLALCAHHTVASWRAAGRRKFVERVRRAAAAELAAADYEAYDLAPLRDLVGADGPLYVRLIEAQERAAMAARLQGMEADLRVLDRKLGRLAAADAAELRYRMSFYEESFEAVIHGGKGGWLWRIMN